MDTLLIAVNTLYYTHCGCGYAAYFTLHIIISTDFFHGIRVDQDMEVLLQSPITGH